MSKKILCACVAAASALGPLPAVAADLPSRKGPPPAPPAPVFTWTGFHIGFNRGFGGAVYDANVTIAAPLLGGMATRTSDMASGWIAGLQAGYDHQFANGFLLGLETDIQWSDIKSSHQAATSATNPLVATYSNTTHSLEWFGTTRARLGYSFGRLLPYVTGGVAYGEITAAGTQVAGALFAGSGARMQVGWTVGSGTEYALTENLSLKGEYLYVSLGGLNGPAAGIAPAPFAGGFTTGRFGTHVTRVGLNWRFGGALAAPVVARY